MKYTLIILCFSLSILSFSAISQPLIIPKDVEPKMVCEGDYVYGIWLNDSTIIATRVSFNGIYKIDIKSGQAEELSDAKWIGYHLAVQNDPDKVIFQNKIKFERQITQITMDKSITPISGKGKNISFPWVHQNTLFFMENGEPKWFDAVGKEATQGVPFAFYENDTVYGINAVERWFIAGGDDQYYSVSYSPTGDRIALEGLNEGIYITDFHGKEKILVGKGNNPAWSPDGKYIIFDRSKDDGYKIYASDIYLFDGIEEYKLTSSWDYIERYPIISPNGENLLFVSEGNFYILPLIVGISKNQ